jgi:hypothetical protein
LAEGCFVFIVPFSGFETHIPNAEIRNKGTVAKRNSFIVTKFLMLVNLKQLTNTIVDWGFQ